MLDAIANRMNPTLPNAKVSGITSLCALLFMFTFILGKAKRTGLDEPGPCFCDDTGICTCATPRTTAHRTNRRSSMPTPISPTVPEGGSSGEKSWPACCLNVDPLSDSASLKYGASAGNTSGSESCCTAPPTPSDADVARLGSNVPVDPGHFNPEQPQVPTTATELGHFNPERSNTATTSNFDILNYSSSFDESLQLPLSTRSRRYTPYPTASQPSALPHAGPSRAPRPSQVTDQSNNFDSDTLALWNQFLQEDPPTGGIASNNSDMPDAFQVTPQANTSNADLLSLLQDQPPSSTCACTPDSSCASCSPTELPSMPQNLPLYIPLPCDRPCTEFDCSTLMAAMALIDADVPAVNGERAAAVRPAPGSSSTSGINPVVVPRMLQNTVSQFGTNALSNTCTCMQKCSCFLCHANPSDVPISAEACDSFQSCQFCTSCRDLGQAIADVQKMTVPAIF